MDFELALAAGGASLISIIATAVGASWRLRTMMDEFKKELAEQLLKEVHDEMKTHVNAEHGKDAGGKTLRERLFLIEATIKSLRRSVERRHDRRDDDSG